MRHHKKKKYRRCKSCGKNRYPSHPTAVDMAAWRMAMTPGTTISVYECPLVKGTYHLTKVNPLHYRAKLLLSKSVVSPPLGPGSPARQ